MKEVAPAMVLAALVCSAGCREQSQREAQPCFLAPVLKEMQGLPSWSDAEKAFGPVGVASGVSKDFREAAFTCTLEKRTDPLMLCRGAQPDFYVCSTSYLTGR